MDIVKKLIEAGWLKNDAKVFTALVELGVSNPQEISKHTGVDRTRVYDSLKRLMEKNYVLKEQKEWGGKYQALPVNEVFSREIKELKDNLENIKEIREELIELEKKSKKEEQLVWAIQGKTNVKSIVKKFVASSSERIYWLQSPDIFGPPVQAWAFEALKERKKKHGDAIDVKISLQKNDGNEEIVSELLDYGINVYLRDEPLLPLALLIIDNSKFIQLSISNFEPLPEYSFGIYGENVSPSQMQGMEYLFFHLLKDHQLMA